MIYCPEVRLREDFAQWRIIVMCAQLALLDELLVVQGAPGAK